MPTVTAKHLGMTPKRFSTSLSAAMSEAGSSLRVSDVRTQKGHTADVMTAWLGELITFTGRVSGGHLTSITMYGDGNGQPQNGPDVLQTMFCLIAVFDPSLMATGQTEIIDSLQAFDENGTTPAFERSISRNGLTYKMSFEAGKPLMFTIGVQA